MNKKQEKYINYIVKDLARSTGIDYEEEVIKYPFMIHTFYFDSPHPKNFVHRGFFLQLSKYIKNLYGTRDEEVSIIWDQYKERIQSLINNE